MQENTREELIKSTCADWRENFSPYKAKNRRNTRLRMTASSGHAQFNFAQPLDVAVAKSWMYFKIF